MKVLETRLNLKVAVSQCVWYRKISAISLCLLFLGGFSLCAQAGIYKWVDEQGITHYAVDKPSAVFAEEVSKQIQKNSNVVQPYQSRSHHINNTKPATRTVSLEINITTVNYALSTSIRSKIESQLNAIYQAYVTWFSWPPNPTRPISIRIFGKYEDFENYQIQHRNGQVINRSHYSAKTKEILMLGTEFTDATLSLLYHESSHAIIDMLPGSYPKWINEGLAEVFAQSNLSEDPIFLAYNETWSEIIKHKLQEGSLLSITDYLKISNSAWGSEAARVENSYYMISWALMRFLLSSDEGVIALRHSINDCRRQVCWNDEGLVRVFDRNYSGGTVQLDKDFRQWVWEH